MPFMMTTDDTIAYIGANVGRILDLAIVIAEYVVPPEDVETRQYIAEQRKYSNFWHDLQDIATDIEEAM